jgi:ribulose-phosphate 3-epimerase
MKISASIYSDKKRSLEAIVEDLTKHRVDLIHVDCNDDLSVFEDIKQIRQLSDIPIDLHIITETPENYFDALRQTPVEFITFQFEQLSSKLEIPSDIKGYKGIAVVTPTPISVFEAYTDFDFILIMATVPGQSGGQFDAVNFRKIRDFQRLYPTKRIHVDGGVNAEVSFILRNLGVYSSVSGSYLFNATSIGDALMNLTQRDVNSLFKVSDFMRTREESPIVKIEKLTMEEVLNTIEQGGLGFCIVEDKNEQLKGLISNADIRKGLLKHLKDFNKLSANEIINTTPVTINENTTVQNMLSFVRRQSFPISYLPVITDDKKASGIVTFVNLIKGEL